MTYFQAVILGIVQGLTEFLPISSSGHLIIVPKIFGWNEHALVFDTTLHLGTAFAILLYFSKDLTRLVQSFLGDFIKFKLNFKNYSDNGHLALKILVGSIPATILGLLFDNIIETKIRGLTFVIVFSLFGTILMILAEYVLGKRTQNSDKSSEISQNVTYKTSLITGIFQSFALLPGVSRSGSTISAGVLLGLNREDAAKFSFLLAMPIVFAAAVFKLVDTPFSNIADISTGILVTGLISSAISGLFAISFLLKFLKTNKLNVFIIYRFILILFLILFIK